MTLNQLEKSQKALIISINTNNVPLKLIEMGCLPGNIVEVLQIAPLSDPIYIKVNDSFLSIRKDLAKEIEQGKEGSVGRFYGFIACRGSISISSSSSECVCIARMTNTHTCRINKQKTNPSLTCMNICEVTNKSFIFTSREISQEITLNFLV